MKRLASWPLPFVTSARIGVGRRWMRLVAMPSGSLCSRRIHPRHLIRSEGKSRASRSELFHQPRLPREACGLRPGSTDLVWNGVPTAPASAVTRRGLQVFFRSVELLLRSCGRRARAGCRRVLDSLSRAPGDTVARLFVRGGLRASLGRRTCGARADEPSSEPCPRHVLQRGMQNDILTSLTRLSDAELVTRVKSLVARERDATAQLVAHLAELETRDLYLREGYGSLHAYCCEALGLSDGEAYNRIEVARTARRFPVILDMLAAGTVTLTAVRLLAPRLTLANHREVLDSARGKKKAEIEEIVARLAPRSDVKTSVRRLPAPRVEALPPAEVPALPAIDPAPLPPQMGPTAEPLSAPRAAVTPLSPDRYKLQLTIGGDTLEKLRLAKDMLSHAIPSGDHAAVLDRALTALLVDLARRKFADTPKPRPSHTANPRARTIPAAVKRAVWVRDLGRCAFVGTSGHRCNERRFVEFHHVDP